MPQMPLSTRIEEYGQYFQVKGDFGDTFLIQVRWDSSVSLFLVDGVIHEHLDEFEDLPSLLKIYPGFSIINPVNANERYLPSYMRQPNEKQMSKKYPSGGWLPLGSVGAPVEKQ